MLGGSSRKATRNIQYTGGQGEGEVNQNMEREFHEECCLMGAVTLSQGMQIGKKSGEQMCQPTSHQACFWGLHWLIQWALRQQSPGRQSTEIWAEAEAQS